MSALLWGDSRVFTVGAGEVAGGLQLQATSLAGVFAALLGLVAVGIAAYIPRYDAPGAGSGLYLALYNLALVASAAVLAAGGVVTFLVAWESMALLSYLLILRHPRQQATASGAFWFLALSETGFVLIIAAFVILATKTHSMELSVIATRAHLVTPAWRDTAYLLALAGFGFKAGLVPLHVWLPEAHPVAPGRRLRVPVRPDRQARRVRHRAVRVPAAARRACVVGLITMAAGASPPPSASCTR